jgi:hypothetical protein
VDCDIVCVGKYGVEAQYEAVHLLYRSVHVGLLELNTLVVSTATIEVNDLCTKKAFHSIQLLHLGLFCYHTKFQACLG